jgi:hypothetical protein
VEGNCSAKEATLFEAKKSDPPGVTIERAPFDEREIAVMAMNSADRGNLFNNYIPSMDRE